MTDFYFEQSISIEKQMLFCMLLSPLVAPCLILGLDWQLNVAFSANHVLCSVGHLVMAGCSLLKIDRIAFAVEILDSFITSTK